MIKIDTKKTYSVVFVVSAVFLIICDIFNLYYGITDASKGSEAFQSIMWFSIPCNLLLAVTSLIHIYKPEIKKAFAVITIVITGIYFIIRLCAVILQTADIINGVGEHSTDEILALVEFFAYLVILAADIVLMVYIITGKAKLGAQVMISIPFIAILIDWIIIVSNYVSAFKSSGGKGFGDFFAANSSFFNISFFMSLISLICCIVIFGYVTGAFDDKKKPVNSLPDTERKKK